MSEATTMSENVVPLYRIKQGIEALKVFDGDRAGIDKIIPFYLKQDTTTPAPSETTLRDPQNANALARAFVERNGFTQLRFPQLTEESLHKGTSTIKLTKKGTTLGDVSCDVDFTDMEEVIGPQAPLYSLAMPTIRDFTYTGDKIVQRYSGTRRGIKVKEATPPHLVWCQTIAGWVPPQEASSRTNSSNLAGQYLGYVKNGDSSVSLYWACSDGAKPSSPFRFDFIVETTISIANSGFIRLHTVIYNIGYLNRGMAPTPADKLAFCGGLRIAPSFSFRDYFSDSAWGSDNVALAGFPEGSVISIEPDNDSYRGRTFCSCVFYSEYGSMAYAAGSKTFTDTPPYRVIPEVINAPFGTGRSFADSGISNNFLAWLQFMPAPLKFTQVGFGRTVSNLFYAPHLLDGTYPLKDDVVGNEDTYSKGITTALRLDGPFFNPIFHITDSSLGISNPPAPAHQKARTQASTEPDEAWMATRQRKRRASSSRAASRRHKKAK